MQVIIGFILGVVASLIASFVFTWITAIFPFERQRWIITLLRNPFLLFKLMFRTKEQEVRNRIRVLFQAWCTKDVDRYLKCWADDCVRVMGSDSTVREDKAAIREKFNRSCAKYLEISTPVVAFENIRISPNSQNAIAEVYYRFELTRAEDLLPTVEVSKEFYSLRKEGNEWVIASNIDYFTDIGRPR